MNTVEALNTLGKALLGDAYTPGVGRTDAETIDDIAKAVSENPIGGGSGLPSIDVIHTYIYSPQGYYNLDSTEVAGMSPSDFTAAFSDGKGNLNHGDILVREVKKYTGGTDDGTEGTSTQIYHFNPDGCPFYETEATYVVYKVVSINANEVSGSTLDYVAAEFTPDEDSDAFTNATIRSGSVPM